MSEQISEFKVNNRKDFIEFLVLLRKDFINNPTGWENNTLERFLEALSIYAEDIQGHYDNTKQGVNANEPNWQTFADIFKGAIVYE